MASNFILPFAAGAGSNVLSDAGYAASAQIAQGFQTGRAPSIVYNKALLQSTAVASGFGQFTADWSAIDFKDNLSPQNMRDNFRLALAAALDGTRMGVDTSSTANQINITLTPAPTTLNGLKTIWIKPAVTNTGPTNVLIAGFSNLPVKRGNGNDPASGDLVAGTWYPAVCDGTKFQILIPLSSDIAAGNSTVVRTPLTAATTYYVSNVGSDANNGLTSGTAFASVQRAWDIIQKTKDLAGYQVTVQVADGTYSAGVLAIGPVVGSPGNINLPAPVLFVGSTSAIINVSAGSCFVVSNGATLGVQGFTLNASGTTGGQGAGIYAANLGMIRFSGTKFGNCDTAGIRTSGNGVIVCDGNYQIAGAGQAHIFSQNGGNVYFNAANTTVTAPSACSYSVAFAWAQAGQIYVTSVSFPGSNVTATRYNVALNGVINTNGGGTNYLSGSAAGGASSGGQYN